MNDELVVYKPVADIQSRAAVAGSLAKRGADLAGATIGLLWNSKPNADVYLDSAAALIAQRFAGIELIRVNKQTSSNPLSPDEYETLRRCRIVINAYGD
jgi:hypothetical protein